MSSAVEGGEPTELKKLFREKIHRDEEV